MYITTGFRKRKKKYTYLENKYEHIIKINDKKVYKKGEGDYI